MINLYEILYIFSYLNDKYKLTDGIYIHMSDAIPTYQYMWPVEGSNLTFKFTTIKEFQDAYTTIINSDHKPDYILYKSNFITFKYSLLYKRVFISTESFNDISYLHTFLKQEGVKEITYSFKNHNN
jgi:hypothetical protein